MAPNQIRVDLEFGCLTVERTNGLGYYLTPLFLNLEGERILMPFIECSEVC
jgi:hypothetical protein